MRNTRPPLNTQNSLRSRVNHEFYRWGLWISRHAVLVIALCCLLTAAMASLLPGMTSDFSIEGYLHPQDPNRVLFNEYRHQFDRGDAITIAVVAPNVFKLEFLNKLRQLHQQLDAQLPFTEEVLSLINARWTHGDAERLVVDEQLAAWPTTEVELSRARERILANPLLLGRLVARDSTATTLIIRPHVYTSQGDEKSVDTFQPYHENSAFDHFNQDTAAPTTAFLTEAELAELTRAIQQISADYQSEDFAIYVSGSTIISNHLNQISVADTLKTTALSLCFLIGLLFALFRRISAVALTIIVITTAMLTGVAAMVPLGIPFSSVSQFLPTLLLAVGTCDAIHILANFYRHIDAGEQRSTAIARALQHSGLPIVMTSTTTAAGLLCFSGAGILPVSDLGKIAPIGIAMALFFSLTLLPAILAIWPHAAANKTPSSSRLRATVLWFGEVGIRHPYFVLGATAVVALGAMHMATRLHLGLDTVGWIPEDDPVRIAAQLLEQKLDGIAPVEVLVDSYRDNGLQDPQLLAQLDAASRALESLSVDGIQGTRPFSIADIVKETHRALNEDQPSYYRIPADRATIAQELLLFANSGSEQIERVVTADFRRARISIQLPLVDSMRYPAYFAQLEQTLQGVLGEELSVSVTGTAALASRTFEQVLRSLLTSYAWALLMIMPMLVFMVGGLRRGLIAMIPNLLPVLVVLGFMGWADIAINPITILAGTVIIGLAVDDTIHFMNGWSHYRSTGLNTSSAIRETLSTTGIALLTTSVALGGCFATYVSGDMLAFPQLGKILTLGAGSALVADILVAPALLTLLEPVESTDRVADPIG